MDWVRQRWEMSEVDLNIFQFDNRRSQVLSLKLNHEGKNIAQCDDIKSEEQWSDWLQKEKQAGDIFSHSTRVL
ncbi:hypothetical protein BKA67DRAFT_581391 [Truncatella angustata]|uniref:Uncharacterized protein n=1 Tax=Truncatella angustata TaxID=152316 RepID=A0A9P8RPQ5_9PEZI|nr:uncharacterized protein BKA67DRAFT_581391 [Truncatella angustata]KAH6647021.1 hypothetical protein BKA67DRAFT_581391 [Truncatella angustata]